MAQRHPDIGETVGEYKVVELLGVGGLGVVFKVERAGRFFAMKFLSIPRLDGRAKREISVLNHLDNLCCVRYVGSDYWPNPITGHPFIIMEYVPGDTLEDFALKHNPAARKVTRIVLDMARTIGEVHAKGVFHRDLKPSNIIMRGATERPVLIDFGIASLVGAACLTGARLPPGTDEYRAPEPLRFEREHAGSGERYEFGPSDELWALGVLFYWLLTDVLPFGERSPAGAVGALYERILGQRPTAPHLLNPRVPLDVSRLCMKMLAEWQADRYPNVPELCAALQEALKQADDDPAWDVPLIDPTDSHQVTTADDPALKEPNETLRAYGRAGKYRPRRGQAPPNDAPETYPVPGLSEQQPAAEVATPVGEHEPPAVAAPVPLGHAQLAPAPAAHPRRSPWLLGLVAALAAVASVGLFVDAGVWQPEPPRSTAEVGAASQPPESPATRSTGWGVRGNEVAIAWDSPQPLFGAGAVPVWAQPPVPAINAMSTQTMKNETPQSQKPRSGGRLALKPVSVTAGFVAACMGLGCTATNNQVRPEPPALNCPQGWEAMNDKLGIGRGTVALTGTKGDGGEKTRIHAGPVTALVDNSALGLPRDTLLAGTWRIEDDRIFATFTQAQVPGMGAVPVCVVVGEDVQAAMFDAQGKEVICPPGLGTCPVSGSRRGNVRALARIRVFSARWF